MTRPNHRRNLNRILPIGIIYLVSGIVYSLNEKGLLGDLDYYPATGNLYAFPDNMLITAGFAFITGLLIGTIETLYLYKLFINRSFTQKILFKTVIYFSVTLSFICINTLINQSIERDVDSGPALQKIQLDDAGSAAYIDVQTPQQVNGGRQGSTSSKNII